jgi:hypothetical protein
MYKTPFIRTLPGGKKVAVLLIDTQGTFDNHMKQEMNAVIFALNSLISSIQVYNVTKRISEVCWGCLLLPLPLLRNTLASPCPRFHAAGL